jgi:hypothetical protein
MNPCSVLPCFSRKNSMKGYTLYGHLKGTFQIFFAADKYVLKILKRLNVSKGIRFLKQRYIPGPHRLNKSVLYGPDDNALHSALLSFSACPSSSFLKDHTFPELVLLVYSSPEGKAERHLLGCGR